MTTQRKTWVSWEEFNALFPGLSPYSTIDFQRVGGLTAGSIPFADASGMLAEDNANLFWDAAQAFLGVGVDVPVCRIHIRLAECAAYAGVIADTVLLIENVGNVRLHLQGATNATAYIDFCDDVFNPPAGRVAYDFANDQLEFVVARNEILRIKAGPTFDFAGTLILDGAIDITGILTLTATGIHIKNNNEIRFYDNGNYVGFEAPALDANQIWVLPDEDGNAGDVIITSGAGVLSFSPAGAGDVTAAANIADHAIVRGNGGVKGVQDSGVIIDDTDNVTGMVTLTLPNEGLHILDTGGDHDLIIKPGTDLGADRILTLTTGDAARTITLSGNPTLADWFDQSVKQASSPTFVTAKLTALTDGYIPYHIDDATGLANSPIFTDGTFVGIGTVPASELHVYADATPDIRVTWGANTSYGRIVFYENAQVISTFQVIGSNFLDANRRGAFEVFTILDAPIVFYPSGDEALRIAIDGNVGMSQVTFGTNATKTLALSTGVAPTTSPADCFQMYSADIGGVAGKAGAHFRDEEGNVISLGSGGVLMSGTARVIKKIYLNNAAFTKGATAPTQVILGNLNAWSFDIGDDAVMTIMLPPDWAAGTLITIKVCWYIDEAYAADKEVQWRVDWSALPHDFSETVDAPTHSGQIDSGDINIPAVAKRMGASTIGTIAGANLSANDMLGFTLSRIAVTNDNPTADPAIHHLIIEYISDKLGLPT